MNEDRSASLEERAGVSFAGGVQPVTASGRCLRVGPRYSLTPDQLELVRFLRASLACLWRDAFSIGSRSDAAVLLPGIGRRLSRLAAEADAWSLAQLSQVAGEAALFVLGAASGTVVWSGRTSATLMTALEILTGLIDDGEKQLQTANRIQRLVDEMSLGPRISRPS